MDIPIPEGPRIFVALKGDKLSEELLWAIDAWCNPPPVGKKPPVRNIAVVCVLANNPAALAKLLKTQNNVVALYDGEFMGRKLLMHMGALREKAKAWAKNYAWPVAVGRRCSAPEQAERAARQLVADYSTTSMKLNLENDMWPWGYKKSPRQRRPYRAGSSRWTGRCNASPGHAAV